MNLRKCNMTAFIGGVGERTLHFRKEILGCHYLYVCCSHKNGPKHFERIINMVAIWQWSCLQPLCVCVPAHVWNLANSNSELVTSSQMAFSFLLL